ncbi:unnamed protein product, partial [Sphacelaria rigidula]
RQAGGGEEVGLETGKPHQRRSPSRLIPGQGGPPEEGSRRRQSNAGPFERGKPRRSWWGWHRF